MAGWVPPAAVATDSWLVAGLVAQGTAAALGWVKIAAGWAVAVMALAAG